MAKITANDASAKSHELVRDTYVLGRHPECDIIVDAGAVSRHHAKITKEKNRFFIEDMDSRNGTFVNDRMVFGKHALSQGDQIRVCDVSFTFLDDIDPSETSSKSMTMLIDDPSGSTMSQVMSSLDISSDDSHFVRLSASTEAKLQALLEIARSLGKSISLDQVLSQLLNSLFKIFLQADRGFIILKDADGRLVPRTTKLRYESEETNFISRTIVNRVIDSKQAILSADAASDERFDMSQSVADFRIRSMVCAPLIDSDGNALGVLQIDTKDQGKRFRQDDLDVLASVAVVAAVAIDNAQMHENMLHQREIERDLQLAREVQMGFLPKKRPRLDSYEFYDYYEPTNHVGGDYFDYIDLRDGRLAIVVADVVGHGIAAALTMSKLSAAVRYSMLSRSEPALCVKQLNADLSEGEFDGRFVTLVLSVLDPRNHSMTVVSAGHAPPIIKRKSGKIIQPGNDFIGFPLLVDADAEYAEETVQLEDQDVLAFFTDGLNEAMNEDGEQYGFDRIIDKLEIGAAINSGEAIVKDVDAFVHGQQKKDDMCIVCLSRT